YIRLDRTGEPLVYNKKQLSSQDIKNGFSILKEGRELYIIATGRMVVTGLEVASRLKPLKIDAGIIDLFKIKPFNNQALLRAVNKAKLIVSLEEHFVNCGLGSILAQLLAARRQRPLLKCIGIPNRFCRRYGSREYLYKFNKIDAKSVAGQIRRWVKETK
ncbi:MAG: transketolase C-terminal domain-containing protein, partial [Candidatus Omnitrophota bacterium]